MERPGRNIFDVLRIHYGKFHLTEQFVYCADILITRAAPLRKCTPPSLPKLPTTPAVYDCLVPSMHSMALLLCTNAPRLHHFGSHQPLLNCACLVPRVQFMHHCTTDSAYKIDQKIRYLSIRRCTSTMENYEVD